MPVTQIDIDGETLAEAMRLSGASTKKDTVNLALREYVERRHRRQSLAQHWSNAQKWDYETWREMRDADKHGRPAR
jgi:Arc/MetJ family transcription regulator